MYSGVDIAEACANGEHARSPRGLHVAQVIAHVHTAIGGNMRMRK